MNKRIFVTAASFRLPAVSDFAQLKTAMEKKAIDSTPAVYSIQKNSRAQVFTLKIDPEAPFYPSRKDVKVMREDVLAATICAQEIMESSGIAKEDRTSIPLYMSNGTCLDELIENINLIAQSYITRALPQALSERHKRVEKATPPLFVLNALTNSAGSFVSQYTGVRGDNTVYGNTSQASYDCLNEALFILNEGADCALVGAASGAGLFSALTLDNLRTDKARDMKMSSGAIFLLLENEESVKRRGVKPLAEIKVYNKGTTVPRLLSLDTSFYQNLKPLSDLAIFSGGVGYDDFALEEKAVSEKWKDFFSFYSVFGNAGVVSPLLNIAGAIVKCNDGLFAVDCLNRDPYGREGMIQIGRVN